MREIGESMPDNKVTLQIVDYIFRAQRNTWIAVTQQNMHRAVLLRKKNCIVPKSIWEYADFTN